MGTYNFIGTANSGGSRL